jgi:hypothetical protein
VTDEFGARSAFHVFAEVPWLQPYPDRLLDELAPSDTQPDAVVVARETIGLTYLAVIQLLPPRQRAVLILRDVLDWSAREAADLLDMTVAAANGALRRARATLRERLPARSSEWSGSARSEEERLLLEEGSPRRASGACCRPAPTASRRPPATSGRRATPSSRRSASRRPSDRPGQGPGWAAATRLGTTMRHASTTSSSISCWSMASSHTLTQL